jgi:hypothetical protein
MLDAYDPMTALKNAAAELPQYEGVLRNERFVHFALATLAELKRLELMRPACDHKLTSTGSHDWDVPDWDPNEDDLTGLCCTDNAYGLIDDLIDHPLASFYLTGVGATASSLFADALTA